METIPTKQTVSEPPWPQNETGIINALPDSVLGISREGKITFLNRSAEEVLGYSLTEIFGQPLKNILCKGFDKICDHYLWPLVNNSASNSKAKASVELLFKKRNADNLRAEVLASATEFPTVAILLSLRDITRTNENKRLAILQTQNDELKKELAIAKDELDLVNQELEAFKFSLAHDLRSPLRIISGYTKIVEKKYENLLNDEAIELLDSIQNYSQRLSSLMAEMLSFSKLGKTEMVFATIDMTSIAQSAINELNNNIKHNAVIKLQPLKQATGDPFMMIRVFYNLLSNAVKYSSIRAHPIIEISSYDQEGQIVYSISDNGIGFDMKYEQMIYSLFYRLHDLKEYEGMGVGLAIVHRIIGRHRGKLWANSQLGKGTTFCFSLP